MWFNSIFWLFHLDDNHVPPSHSASLCVMFMYRWFLPRQSLFRAQKTTSILHSYPVPSPAWAASKFYVFLYFIIIGVCICILRVIEHRLVCVSLWWMPDKFLLIASFSVLCGSTAYHTLAHIKCVRDILHKRRKWICARRRRRRLQI